MSLIITFLLTSSLFSQINDVKNQWAKRHLNGEVASMKYLKYEINYVNDSTFIAKIEDFIIPSNYILIKKGEK